MTRTVNKIGKLKHQDQIDAKVKKAFQELGLVHEPSVRGEHLLQPELTDSIQQQDDEPIAVKISRNMFLDA